MVPRVVVTGRGLVTTLAEGVRANVAALYEGQRPTCPEGWLPSSLREPPLAFPASAPRGARLLDALGGLASRLDERPLVRTTELGLLALREALEQSGLALDLGDGQRARSGEAVDGRRPAPSGSHARAVRLHPSRVGVCVGTTVGCAFDAEDYYRAVLSGERPGSAALNAYLANDLSAVLASVVGARGPRATVVNACASSADAIGMARRWLVTGECDAVVCGGADALHRFPFLGFGVLKNSSTTPCRPFDRDRSGLNLGDGAAMLVLEREEDAMARGRAALGEIAGYATSADAHHLTAPHPEGLGLRDALDRALRDAQIAPPSVGFAHAHGTGTTHNDRVEGQALASRFGEDVVVFSTKGYFGHTLGAAGAVGAVIALEHLRDGRVPASAGFETPDPECGVVPTRESRELSARAAVSCSLAFGGTNSVLVLVRRGEQEGPAS